jgi:hypothetical protein
MPKYTEDSVKTELASRKYPLAYFEDAEFSQVVSAALRDFDRYCATTTVARFNTLTEIQDYYIFNPNDVAPPSGYPLPSENVTTDEGTRYVVPPPIEQPDGSVTTYTGTQGICANAKEITDIFWQPGGDFSSLNVFSPGWQLLSQTIIYSGSYFNMPAMMMVLNQKLNAFKHQFGDQGWELFGQVGDPEAFLRIYPLPLESQSPVIVKFTQGATLDTIKSKTLFTWLMYWVEYRMSEAVANLFSQSAGTNLLGFTDSTAGMKYWAAKAEGFRRIAVETMGGLHGQVDRS